MKYDNGSTSGAGVLFAQPAEINTSKRKEVLTDAGTVLVLHDINVMEVLALPGIPALIHTGRAELVAVRPLTNNSLRILLALAEHGRVRAIALTATIVEEVRHA